MLPPDFPRPDFYIASIGRTGSTLIANWLTEPPERIVLIEPFLFALRNPDMVRAQFDGLDMPVSDADWDGPEPGTPDTDWQERFRRIFLPRLSGRQWALKEVLNLEHERVIETFAPPRVIVTVRDIRDVATSFIEKHRIQNIEQRFDHRWVRDYCLRETAQIVALCRSLSNRGTAWRSVRYEDFIASQQEREDVAGFVGWPGGGDVARHYDRLRRGFEVERNGSGINARARRREERDLTAADLALVDQIADGCADFQSFFGY